MTLGSGDLGSTPCSATQQLCDYGEASSTPYPALLVYSYLTSMPHKIAEIK